MNTELNDIFINEYPSINYYVLWDDTIDFIKSISIKNYFYLTVLFCSIFLIFKKSYIITLIIFILCLIIYVLYKNKINAVNNTKKSILYPKSKQIENTSELYNFFFSVQEFYDYNPQTYTHIIIDIDKILYIYNEIKINNKEASQYYDVIKDLKYETLNLFQSFIFKLPDDNNIIVKYNKAKFKLEELLNKYTDDVFKINRDYIKKNGFDYTIKLLSEEKLKEPANSPFGNTERILSDINKII